ncbi:RNA recognition motif. (a.k.a. RRM, RBD, or RNP domain), putative [Leishmania lindenbergi]|uniref:RNA recognition motif (RRM, RBD, or RNP domain) n=1 Tax=Leishmania lindenbergi TaxID=651832 RepID=A0AAW3A439_9TRYP
MMKTGSVKPIVTASPMPIDVEQQQQQLHPRATSASSPSTPPISATKLRQSAGGAAPPSNQSLTSAPISVGGGGAYEGFPGTLVSSVQSPDVLRSSFVPAKELTLRQYTPQQCRADAIAGRSPTNYGTSGGVAGSRPVPTLSVERLGEPVLMPGLPGTAAGAAIGMCFVTPISGVLDAPSTPPSSTTTPANMTFSISEYPGVMTTSPTPTPMTPTEHSSTNLILYNIGSHMTEAALQKLFDPFGEVVSCAVMRDIHTGVGLGTGFVRYSDHMEACRALEAFSDRMNPVCAHDSKPLVVQWARKQHDCAPAGEARKKIMKLFVRNIPLECSIADLEELFGVYGGVRQVTLHKDTSPVQDETMTRLIAFVIYTEEGAAERAAREVHNTKPFASCHGIPIMVKLAESSQRRRFMKNSEATGPSLLTAVPAGFPGSRTSPMTPGMSGSLFDMAAEAQHQQLLQQKPNTPQQGMCEAHGVDASPSSCRMPVFGCTVAYAPPDPRETSISCYPGTPQPLQVSVSGGGTPATVASLASNMMGGSPGRYHQQILTHVGEREGRVSPHSSSAAAPMQGHSYQQAASLSFDASAAAVYSGLSTFSKSNCQSFSDGRTGGSSGGVCPSRGFLHCSSSPGDANSTAVTAAADGGSPQMPASGPWYETAGGGSNQSGGFMMSAPPTRRGAEATRSPPAPTATSATGSVPPPGPLRLGSTLSVAFPSARGSLQQSTGVHRTSPTSMPVPGGVPTSHSVPGAFAPIGGQMNVALQPSTKLSILSSASTSDMSSVIPSNNFGSGTAPLNGAAHKTESPTIRTDASESWRRAVRTHVHNVKRQNDLCNVSGSLSSILLIRPSCNVLAPATSSPTAAQEGGMLSLSGNEASAPGTTPSTSPISNSTLSGDQTGPKSIGTGSPSSGRMRYYNNPYSSESTKLFC